MEFDGTKYAAASTHQKEWGAKLMSELSLRGDERILDLGCGDGALTAALADLAPEGSALGIDASEGMIRAAAQQERSNLTFERLDINKMDFADEFDLVFSNAALHWVKDHGRLLARIHHALKPGGAARLNFAGEGNCSTLFKVVQQAMGLGEYAAYFNAFEWPWYMPSVDGYCEVLERSPFDEFRAWGENADRHFPDAEAMVKWIDQPSLVPFLTHVDDADKAAFRDFVVVRMVEETRHPDGRCFETFRRINVLATK